MGKTIPQSGSPSLFFLDQLHRAGVQDSEIDGTVADDAVGGPGVGICRTGGAKDGKVEASEIFAVAFNNLVKHGETLKRYFQKLDLPEVAHLQNDGQFDATYRERVQKELLGSDPQRSLKAWPNPKKLSAQDPGYAAEWLRWAAGHTRLPLLPYKEQVEVLKQVGLGEVQVKGELGKLWKGQTLPKLVAQASVLRGEELLREARELRGVGDAKQAQDREKSAARLFRTAVELDGQNPGARRHWAEALAAQGRYEEAGLHFAQALRTEPDLAVIGSILERLSGKHGDEMLGKQPDAYSFVGLNLKAAGRYGEAALIFHQAAEAATAAGQHEKSLAFTEQEMLAQEAANPYLRQFSQESNPVAHALYGALRDAGIPSALIDGASGKEGDLPDHKIDAAEVFGYLDGHLNEPRVQAALKKVHFQVPWLDAKGRLKKEFDTPEFAKQSFAQRMAAWHAKQAASGAKGSGHDTILEKHLLMASYYEPDQAARQRALGDFYATRDPAKARDAYLKAVGLDPTDKSLQLPLGKALAETGDSKGAVAAFDAYLAVHPDDTSVQTLRSQAERGRQSDLRKGFDTELLRFHSLAQVKPAEALASLKTLEGLAAELENAKAVDPLDRIQNLQRTQTFYDSVINLEAAHTTYDRDTIWNAQSRLYKAFSEAGQTLRDSLKVPEGGTPTREQVDRALAFAALVSEDKTYRFARGQQENLQTAAKLIDRAPSSVLNDADRIAAYDRLFAQYGQLVKQRGKYANDYKGELKETMHQAAASLLSLQYGVGDSPEKKLAGEVLTRLIDDANTKMLPFCSSEGLKTFVQKSAEAETAYQAALKVTDVRERRGALLQAMGNFARLQDEKKVGEALAQLQATVDDKMSDADKLQILTGAYLAVRDSGLPQETQLLDSSKLLAFKMSLLKDTSSPSADVKRLLLLKSYYETVGDSAGIKGIAASLEATRDSLLNELHYGRPAEGKPKPTDAKTRLELASLSVQIDQALLSNDLSGGPVGKLSKEERTTLYLARLEVWRKELAKATGLPYAERLEQARALAQSAATYKSLSEGDQAFLDKTKVDASLAALEKEIAPLLQEYFAQDEKASPAQKALAEKITQDLQDRFHAALTQGDAAWISANLSGDAMLAFGEKSQMAHSLLMEAGAKLGPKAVQTRLQATALFLELGLDGRVKEAMGPVQEFAMKLRDPKQKAGMLLTVTQAYQQAGLKTEAKAALQAVIDLDSPSAPREVHELAVLAKGMQQLNAGELGAAQETLAGIPKNPMAQLMLAKLTEGTEQRRLRMTFDALAPVLFSIYQGKKTDLTDAQAAEIREKVQATLQRWQKQLASGEIRSLDDAFRNDLGGFYHESFEGEVTKSFIRRISNPDMTDQEFASTLLGFSKSMLRAEKYAAAMGIAQLLEQDPQLGAAAKAVLADIPGQARLDGILRSLKNMTIIFAESDEEALKSAAIMIVSFGVGRLLAVGAEAAWVARAATFIESPIVLRASTFAVKTTAEAAGFTLGSMTMETIWSGKTSHWNLKHFGTEFGSMLVTFFLLHGVGMGMQGFSAASARYLGRAEAGMARALEGGGGIGGAAFNVRLATGMNAVAKSGVTAWGSRILAFTGTEYVNEAIGLRPKENVPFWIRLAGSAVTDAQMVMAGKGLDAVSGGRISKLEKASQMKLAQHQMNFQAKELMPLVERMGFDVKSPAGRMVWEALLTSRVQGESLKSIEARTSAAEQARLDKAVAEAWGLDPKSPEGQGAKAQLMAYAQLHPFASPGKPLGAAETAEIVTKLNGEAAKLLRDAGIERGPAFEALRRGILGFALQSGLEPSQVGEYARHAKALQAPLQGIADRVLGPDGAKTPEGQALMGELAVYAMFRAPSAEKFAEPLQALASPELGGELHTLLKNRADLLFGKHGAETPAGRAFMAKLLLRALHGSEQASDLVPALQATETFTLSVAPLADVAGFKHPKDRLALASWAQENGLSAEALRGMTTLVLRGEIELRSEAGTLHLVKVPAGEQAAKAAEVRERLPELPSEFLREDPAALRRAEEEIIPVTDDMILPLEPEGKVGDRNLGVATFKPMPAIEAKADKIAKAKPSAERLARYSDYIMKKEGLTREEADARALQWAEQVILDARTHQLKQTHIYDTSLVPRPETQHLDKATIDHHGRFGNPKNATEQLLDRLEATLDIVRDDPQALKAAREDKTAMKTAGGDPVVAAALRELNLREVTTDNLADGGWCVWIAKNQARVLGDPGLRKLIAEATHFEDFSAFGTEYNPKDPSVRLQAALFQKYGEILKDNGIIGSDRFPPEKAEKVMGEALAAIDKMVGDPAAREAAAAEFFQKVEAGREKAAADALMPEASVHDADTNLSFFDLTKLGDFTVFQQWLALPRVEPKAGSPDTLQVSVVPMKPATARDGSAAPRTLQIVAIPNGRELPSGKGLLSVLERMNAAEKAKAEKLGVEANTWFGKDNVILPNPAKGGTLLTPKEVSDILTSPEAALFRAPDKVIPLPKVADADATKNITPKKIKPPADDQATNPGFKTPPQAIAARRAATPTPVEKLPETPIEVLSPISLGEAAKLPPAEVSRDGQRIPLSFEAGAVVPLGVQDGALVQGAEVKAPLAEIEVMKSDRGELGFYFRRSGDAEHVELTPGTKFKVGDAEFTWEGPTEPLRPQLKLVDGEPTKREGVPLGAKPPTLKGKPGFSPTEVNAHAFLDFYFGENGSYATVKALSERSAGGDRDLWADQASDFLMRLTTFRSKVERFDQLEKDFDAHRAEFKAAEGKDPAKAAEAARAAEASLAERKALELELEKDLTSLQAEPYNQVELQYQERIEVSEKQLIPLDFALATAQVEATIAVRGTNETPALHFETVYKPLLELPESHYDQGFKRLPLGELVRAEVRVTKWEAAERALDLMVDEGILGREQLPDLAQLRASGAREFSVRAEIPGEGPVEVIFRFEGKAEVPAKPVEKPASGTPDKGSATMAGMFLGLTTLLAPEVAHAATEFGAPADSGILPWLLGTGAALLSFGLGTWWLSSKKGGKGSEELRGRRGSAAEKLDQTQPLLKGPVTLSTKAGIGLDLASFLADRPLLADSGRDFGLSRAEMLRLEGIFERGGSVDVLDMGGRRWIMVTDLVSGAETINGKPGSEQELAFYEAWKVEHGIPKADKAQAQRAWKELQQRAQSLGIVIQFDRNVVSTDADAMAQAVEAHAGYVVYLNELMKLLPDSMIKNSKFKGIRLGSPRSDAAQLSRYDEQSQMVDLFRGSFTGARRYLAGLFFHEVGHSTAERYMPGAQGDPKIPAAVRDQMVEAHRVLAASPKGMLGLDWANGPEGRAGYQASYNEFLAELNLIYVTAGPKLRAHIEGFPQGSAERKAWDFVYGEMKNRIFGGIEYGYDQAFQPKAQKAPVLQPLPVRKQAVAPAVAKPAKVEVNKAPVAEPVPGPVDMVLQDNAPGQGRQGSLAKPATAEYGSFSVVTGEGVGYKADHNEDGFVQGRNWGLVLDGMGGMGSGDKASELAGKQFAIEMQTHGDMVRAMVAAGDAVNASPYASGGAVAVAHQIVRNPDGSYTARIVHVGDAGAIVFRRNAKGEFEQVFRTEEQSIAGMERKMGKLHNTMEMRISPQANVVLGGLGVGKKAQPEYNEVRLQPGDVLLSFSDGVGDNVSAKELSDILKASGSAQEVATRVNELVLWKMEQLAKAKAVAKGQSNEGTLLESYVEQDAQGRKVHRWKVELADMLGYTINESGNVFDAQGRLVDHYKADNVTIHAYVHDLPGADAAKPAAPKPAVGPMDFSDVKTVIVPNPMNAPGVRWMPNGEWVLPQGFQSVTVGSDTGKGAMILVRDPRVSGRHAEILESAGEFWLRDSGSTNGTYLNGKKLESRDTAILSSGDVLTFANQSYQFDAQNGSAKLTPVLFVPSGQTTLQMGPATLFQGNPGVFFIRNDGSMPLKVGGSTIPADGNAYRIRDRELVQIGEQNFIFRQF
ncbi:MAG: FHA domain-containing protein [bacterium]